MRDALLQDQPTSAVALSLLLVVPTFILAGVLTWWLAPRIFWVITTFGGDVRKVWKVMFATLIFDVFFLGLLVVAYALLVAAISEKSPLFWHTLGLALTICAVISAPGLVSMLILPFVKARVPPNQSGHDGNHIDAPEND